MMYIEENGWGKFLCLVDRHGQYPTIGNQKWNVLDAQLVYTAAISPQHTGP
jgi:hypothetical protein